jgi:MFS family permease
LSKSAWTVLGGDALSAVGTGLTLPFLFVYLHRVRGIGVAPAELALSTIAVASVFGNVVGGWLGDRIGARSSLVVGLSLAAVGSLALTLVRGPVDAFAAVVVLGLGLSIEWPSLDALLAVSVADDQRSAVFSVRYATMNAGLAVGSLIAAGFVTVADAGSFELIYVLDAATYLIYIPVVLSVGGRPAARGQREHAGGYGLLLRDRVFMRVWVLTALLFAAGYSQLSAALPAYATGPGRIGASALAIVFAANTLTVVLAQLVVLRIVRGWRRTTSIVLACACWAACWAIALAAAGLRSAVLFGLAAVVFGLGETLLSPALGPIVNDLAPAHLRGRYNGAYTLARTIGFILGPPLAAVALSGGGGAGLFVGLIAACGAAAALAASLRARLPERANLIGEVSSA